MALNIKKQKQEAITMLKKYEVKVGMKVYTVNALTRSKAHYQAYKLYISRRHLIRMSFFEFLLKIKYARKV